MDGITTKTYSLTITRASADSFVQQAYLKASNADANDQFGSSVAIDGDTIVVGAPGEASSASGSEADDSAPAAGAAYVFTRSGGVWTQEAYLKASNAEADDQFGCSVAIDGDTIVVGAYQEDSSASGGETDNNASDAGAAYVFTRSGGVWTQQAYLKASNAEASDKFGFSVGISGDTVVVGAYGEASGSGVETDNSASEAGAAYVFSRSGGIWTQQAYLKANVVESSDFFGKSVAIDGDTIVVGGYGEDSSTGADEFDNTAGEAGAAYRFSLDTGVWVQTAYFKASNAEANDGYGYSVDIDGGTLAIGANQEASGVVGDDTDNSAISAGAAYAGGNYLKASNVDAGDNFGFSVAIDSGNLIVGAYAESSSASGSETDNSAPTAGAAYLFSSSGGWIQRAFLKASNAGINDSFGTSVSISGDTVVVGAPNEDSSTFGGEADNSASNAGAAYIWQ
jgi:hypothetical protein